MAGQGANVVSGPAVGPTNKLGLAGWVAGGQGSTGQKVWLPSTPIFDLIEYTIELGRP